MVAGTCAGTSVHQVGYSYFCRTSRRNPTFTSGPYLTTSRYLVIMHSQIRSKYPVPTLPATEVVPYLLAKSIEQSHGFVRQRFRPQQLLRARLCATPPPQRSQSPTAPPLPNPTHPTTKNLGISIASSLALQNPMHTMKFIMMHAERACRLMSPGVCTSAHAAWLAIPGIFFSICRAEGSVCSC